MNFRSKKRNNVALIKNQIMNNIMQLCKENRTIY